MKEAKHTGGSHLHMTTSISQYRELVEKIKTKVKLVKSVKSAKIKELEKMHYQKHGTLPAKIRGSHYYNILKERNVAIAILRAI